MFVMKAVSPLREKLGATLRRIAFPLPEDQAKQGFEPNAYIRFLRRLAGLVIYLLRLDGKNRFSNEFIQMLDPKLTVILPGGETLVFRTGHGRLLWRARTFQSEEPMILDWINQFSAEDCFYDVGANVGSYSLYAAKKGVQTFAFEPEFNNLQLLYDNIFLNQVQAKCTPVPIGLGESTRMGVFFLKSVSKGDALHGVGRKSYLLDAPSSACPKINVLVAKLDDLIEIFGLPRPTRIKIDVDGNELNVIQGAMHTLDYVRDVYVEVDIKQTEHCQVLDILTQKGFHLIRQESIATTWNPDISNCLFSKQ